MSLNKIKNIKNNPKFILEIVKKIENEIKRNINKDEEHLIISAVKNIPNSYFTNYSIPDIIRMIQDTVVEDIAIDHCEINDVDVHEILKHNIIPDKKNIDVLKKNKKNSVIETNIDSIFGYTDIATLVKKVNEPISSVNNIYILLDTRYRNLGNDGTAFFSWSHINQLTIAQGTVNSLGNIRNIISIILMPVKIPNTLSTKNSYDLITISVEEFVPQSVIAHEDRRYHFMSCIDRSKSTDKWLFLCSDDYNKGEYKFNKPITSLDTITLKFGSPLEPVLFDKDRLLGTFKYGNPTIINFTENHNLTSDDIVYIDNFYTINTQYDHIIINSIKSSIGHVSTYLTSTSISIPVNSSSIVTVLTGTVSSPTVLLTGTINVTNDSDIIIGIGTVFNINFIIGDYIQIQNGIESPIFQIQSIQSDTQLTIKTKYTFLTGTYTYRKTGISIIGTGTSFINELKPGDNLIINDGNTNPEYIIKSIQSSEILTIKTPYNGINGNGFTINKDNSIAKSWSVFFGSKRIFIPMEITYLSS